MTHTPPPGDSLETDGVRCMVISLEELHTRHPGLTAAVCAAYAEAAAVCLARHHRSPRAVRTTGEAVEQSYEVSWRGPSEQQQAAWANHEDATRDGAYSVALAIVEAHLGLVTTARTAARSGSDYYLVPAAAATGPGELDLEDAIRLEVSGIGEPTTEAAVLHRLGRKVDQARRASSALPALAAVVAFGEPRIALRRA